MSHIHYQSHLLFLVLPCWGGLVLLGLFRFTLLSTGRCFDLFDFFLFFATSRCLWLLLFQFFQSSRFRFVFLGFLASRWCFQLFTRLFLGFFRSFLFPSSFEGCLWQPSFPWLFIFLSVVCRFLKIGTFRLKEFGNNLSELIFSFGIF